MHSSQERTPHVEFFWLSLQEYGGFPKLGVPPLEVLTKTGPSILQSAAKQQGSDAPGPSTVLEVAGASALGFALEVLDLGFGFGGFCSVFVCR